MNQNEQIPFYCENFYDFPMKISQKNTIQSYEYPMNIPLISHKYPNKNGINIPFIFHDIPLYPILPPTPQVTSPLHRLHRRRRQDGAEPSWDSHPIGPMEQLMVKSCTEGFTRPGKH